MTMSREDIGASWACGRVKRTDIGFKGNPSSLGNAPGAMGPLKENQEAPSAYKV